MRYKTRIIYSVITIGVLLAGLLLPRQILHMQDQRQAARVDRYELNNITLNVTGPLFEKLSAVKAGIIVGAGSQVDVRMNEEEAYEQMLIAIDRFGACAMDMKTLQEPDIAQRLLIDEENGNSFIIWMGHLEDEYHGVDVVIDDATGKMLGITTVVYDLLAVDSIGYNLEELQGQLKTYYELADVMPGENGSVDVDGLADAYGLTPEEIERVMAESNGNIVSFANDFDSEVRLVFRLVNETGEYYDVELYISDGDMYSINWM